MNLNDLLSRLRRRKEMYPEDGVHVYVPFRITLRGDLIRANALIIPGSRNPFERASWSYDKALRVMDAQILFEKSIPRHYPIYFEPVSVYENLIYEDCKFFAARHGLNNHRLIRRVRGLSNYEVPMIFDLIQFETSKDTSW